MHYMFNKIKLVVVLPGFLFLSLFISGCSSFTKDSANNINLEEIFVNLDDSLLQRDPNIQIEADKGFIITTSILSNSKNKIVYSEISDCIGNANSYDPNAEPCDWSYNINIKDLQTSEIKNIYEYPEKTSYIQNITGSFVPTAYAGGCRLVHFPIAWSKNDKKIILQWGNPTSCGSGGAPKYMTYTLSSERGELEELSTYEPLFIDNYSKVIFIDESEKSPLICGPASQSNYGKIVMKDIETDEAKTLLEEENSFYSDLKFDEVNKILTYSANETPLSAEDGNACSSIDYSKIDRSGTINISSF